MAQLGARMTVDVEFGPVAKVIAELLDLCDDIANKLEYCDATDSQAKVKLLRYKADMLRRGSAKHLKTTN